MNENFNFLWTGFIIWYVRNIQYLECPPFSLIVSCTQAAIKCTGFSKQIMCFMEAKKSDFLFKMNKFAYLISDLITNINRLNQISNPWFSSSMFEP